MPYKEKPVEKFFYSIGEVAQMFNVNTSLIRFWEKEFDIIKPKKNNKGNRLFTRRDIDNFHKIYQVVKKEGMTLKGAKNVLNVKRFEVSNKIEIINSLNKIKSMMEDLKNIMK